MVYVAFVIDVFARRPIVGDRGWRVSRTASAQFVLDALEQAVNTAAGPPSPARSTTATPPRSAGRVSCRDRIEGLLAFDGVHYVSIKYAERLAEAGIDPSVGSVGDSYDNALAETMIGLLETAVIRRQGPWRSLEAVEIATMNWVDWYNNRRLLGSIGNIPPAEAEANYRAALEAFPMPA